MLIKGPENILSAGVSVHLSARKFYRLGSEGVNVGYVLYEISPGCEWIGID